jgi:hypothetical protein
MKKCIFILTLILVFCAACAAEITDVTIDKSIESATIDDIIVPFYLPQTTAEGTEVLGAIRKKGDKATIYNGEETLVSIDYYDKGAKLLESAPKPGKAAVTADGGSYTLVMMLNENIGVVMTSRDITKEELIKTANSFYLEEGPAE